MEKKKILVVDDEQGLTAIIKLNLEGTGKFAVKIENKGTNVLSAVREFSPDLILMDIIMPDMTGGEVAHQLRNNPATKNIPIVFLTAIMTKEEEAKSQGTIAGTPCIAKPVALNKLVAIIEEQLIKKTMRENI